MNNERGQGRVFLGYETVQPACCKVAGASQMRPEGWVMVGVLAVFAFPLVWLPFVMPCLHRPYTRAVYGHSPPPSDPAVSSVHVNEKST